jgi:predicted transcriptional regulator
MTPSERTAQLKHLMLTHRDELKALLLSDRDLALVELTILRGSLTTADVSKEYKNSSQSASQSLKRLKKKGYLCAQEEPDPTGGYLLRYRPNVSKTL